MIKKLPLYIFLLPAVYLVHNYNQLFGFIPFRLIALFWFWTALFTGIVFGLSWLLTKSVKKSAVTSFFALLFTLYFGLYHNFVKDITGGSVISSYKVIVPLTLILIFLLLRNIIKHPASLQKFTHFANTLFIILLGVELATTGVKWYGYTKDHNLVYANMPVSQQYVSCNKPDSAKPDIYLILFDEYTNSETLRKLWQFDNSDIENYLSQKGFYIIDHSKASYNYTPYSISSMLNMNYIDQDKEVQQLSAYHAMQGIKSMTDNETIRILKKENYRVSFITSVENPFQNTGMVHEFGQYPAKQLYSQTFFCRFTYDLGWNLQNQLPFLRYLHLDDNYTNYQKRAADVLTSIEKIKSTANDSANRPPQFVFGHLLVTHKPHLYDSAGGLRSHKEITDHQDFFTTYTNQIKQGNRVIKELVEHINRYNKKNTIIIIAGDHGFRHLPVEQSQYYFPNFCTVYFPGRDYSQLNKNMNSVNLFRAVFNTSFCQRLPALADRTVLK